MIYTFSCGFVEIKYLETIEIRSKNVNEILFQNRLFISEPCYYPSNVQSKYYVGKNDVGGILVMRCCKIQSFAAQLKMIKSILFLQRSNELLEEVYIIFSLQFRLVNTGNICKTAFVYILMLACELLIILHHILRTKFMFFIVSCCYWDIIL